MLPFLAAVLLLLELPLFARARITTTDDMGILQLVTPTTHASLVPTETLEQLSEDAYSFWSTYSDADTFDFGSAIATAVGSAAAQPGGGVSLIAKQGILIKIYEAGVTSLLDNPTDYLSRLSASATPWPFSSELISHASGILLGYESLVSEDVLNKTASQVTPGMSIRVGPASTAVGTTAAAGGQATGTSTSKALGVPAATANSHLMYGCGAAAAAGILGMVLL